MVVKSYEKAYIIGLDWKRWEPMVGPVFANRIARSSRWARAGFVCFFVWLALGILAGLVSRAPPERIGEFVALIWFCAMVAGIVLLFVSANQRGKVALSIRDDLRKAGYKLNEPPTLYLTSSFVKWCARHSLTPELVRQVGEKIGTETAIGSLN